MCLLIAQPENTHIGRKYLENGYMSNPDGAGYAFVKDGHIQVRKFKLFDEFYKAYRQDHKANKHTPFLIHFRWATHGGTTTENIHPFRIRHAGEGETVFGHNGILPITIAKHEQHMSDTRVFGRDILAGLPSDWMTNPATCTLVESYIGTDKLVVLTTAPGVEGMHIVNEQQGEWHAGVWYSNNSYRMDPWIKYASKSQKTKKNTMDPFELDEWYGDTWRWTDDDELTSVDPAASLTDTQLAAAVDRGYCPSCLYRPCACDEMCWDCGGHFEDAGNPCTCCWNCSNLHDTCDCDSPLYADEYIMEQFGFRKLDRYITTEDDTQQTLEV